MAIKEILVPDLGGAERVDVIEINVKTGDRVELDQGIITLESDKATMEVPASYAGIIHELRVKVGDKISEGQCVAVVKIEAEATQATENAMNLQENEKEHTSSLSNEESIQPAFSAEQIVEVIVPDLGGAEKVDVIDINVNVGDPIDIDQGIITLESDKATMEVPSPFAGVIEHILVKVGDKLSEGDKVASIKISSSQSSVTKSQKDTPAVVQSETVPEKTAKEPPRLASYEGDKGVQALTQTAQASAINPHVHATPLVRRLASEFGVDLSRVQATGRKGRILKEDVQAYIKQQLVLAQQGGSGAALPQMPIIDFSKFGEVETQALSKIKKLTGTNLSRNWILIPHVTQFEEADITDLEWYRKIQKATAEKRGVKLTPLVFIMKAVVAALKEFPRFNASLSSDNQSLILKKYFHIGIAVDTPDGLVVPVIRDVDQKDIYVLAKELGEVSEKARQQKLLPKDMQGGCFTISSLGGIGGTAFTPIVNAPEVAILGVSKSQMKPVYQHGNFVPRLLLPLSLSYDHRVIDGAEGARFVSYLSKILADVEKLIV